MADKVDIRDEIAARFVEALNNGTVPWRKPWSGTLGRPRNGSSNRPYRGVNAFVLGMVQSIRGYPTGQWFTYNNAKNLGGNVRTGEKGTAAILWKFLKKTDAKTGKDVTIPMCRSFTVFNHAQCDGLPVVEVEASDVAPIVAAQAIVDGMANAPTIVVAESDAAFYSPASDRVTVPLLSQFSNGASYYAVMFHEMAHATGHESRLKRDGVMAGKGFGSDSYSEEELIAEMTSAFLCAEAGILDEVEENSKAYVANWAAKIGNDPRLVIKAAGAAQRAADHILGTTFATD